MLVILCHVYKWFFFSVSVTTCSQPYLRNVCNNLHVLCLVFPLYLNSLPEGNYNDASTFLLLQQNMYIENVIAFQENIGHVTLTYACIVVKGCVTFLILVIANHDIASNNICLCFICPISVISAKGLFVQTHSTSFLQIFFFLMITCSSYMQVCS